MSKKEKCFLESLIKKKTKRKQKENKKKTKEKENKKTYQIIY
jgi:hypothetical protein